MCFSCDREAFDPDSLLPRLLSNSLLLRASNIFPIVFSCGHIFHLACLFGHEQKCPIDRLPPLSVVSPENSSTGNLNSLRRGFPSMFLGEDDFILQFTLSHYYRSDPFLPRVVSADIVTNTANMMRFEKAKKRLEARGLGDSHLLFHGTPYDNVASICHFNFTLVKVANGRVHGDGVYFSDR